jgi:hypothetical protein
MYSPGRSFLAEPDKDGGHQQEDADNEEAIIESHGHVEQMPILWKQHTLQTFDSIRTWLNLSDHHNEHATGEFACLSRRICV